MNPYEFKKLVESVKYKPNTKIVVSTDDAREVLTVSIRMKVQDAYKSWLYNKFNDTNVHLKRVVSYTQLEFMPDEHAKYYIRQLFLEMETHEMDEFISIDGVRVFDPHKRELDESIKDENEA